MQSDEMQQVQKILHADTMPKFTKREFCEVKILAADSPDGFYVLKSQDVDEWKEFNRRLGEKYESEFVTIGQPSVGLNCCAFQSEHKTWRRCEIIKLLDDGRCEVNFFDIGLTVTVLPTQLAMLNTEFDEHKPFAVHCMLSTTSNDSECFADIAKLPYPFFVYVDRPSHAAQDVVLFYKVDERFVCVNNFFCEESSTESLPSSAGSVVLNGKSDAAAPNSVVWNSKSDAPAPNATATHIQSNKTIVKIENIEAINRIYVSTTMTAEHYQQVHEDVQQFAHVAEMSNTMCSEDGQLWKENDYCLVQYERSINRKEWFRGKIVDVKDDTVCLVYLRDVGKTIEVETSKLKKITPDLQKVRNAAFKCNLSSVELNDLYSGESVKDKLLELLQQYDSTAISIYGYQKEKGAFSIILWAANVVVQALSPPQYNWTNINQELVNLSYLTAIEPFSVDVDGEDNAICEYVYEEQNTDISLGQKVTDERNYVEDWLPSVPIEQSDFYGTPTYITRSCVIFILKHERKAVAEKMEQILEMKRVAGELKARDKWKVGFPCFVPFNDGRYYRGKILELWPEKGLCAVRFIDYGNTAKCLITHLRRANMFANIPALVRAYCLDDIQPNSKDGNWSEKALQYCSDTILEKTCHIQTLGDDGSKKKKKNIEPCRINIYTRDKDLRTALIRMKFGKPAI